MCYSKEVSLTVAVLIFSVCIGLWYYFSNRYHKHLRPFYGNVLVGMALIGGHQLSEFLSVYFESDSIYRVGLILSLSSMYFFMRSLETLTHYQFRSHYFIPIIFLIIVHVFLITTVFSENKFWVRGESHLFWALIWLLLFIYWHVCTIYVIRHTRVVAKSRILKEYLWEVLDVSFFISIIYVFVAYVGQTMSLWMDAPSIWCTFFVVQVLFIPRLFSKIGKTYTHDETQHVVSWTDQLKLILISVVIFVVVYLVSPLLPILAEKFVFR